jgi:ABC-type Zn uptake system ZnuABC Zn-binding protein ZnuA
MRISGHSFLGLLAALLLLTACVQPIQAPAQPSEEDGRLSVVSTVSPITNIIHNIGGDRIQLSGIVPEGVNSHTFLEQPTLALAEANLKEGGEIVLLGEQTITPDEYVFDFSFPEEGGNPNPHLWTNPLYALKYAEIVRDKLSERDEANAEYYQENYERFAERIAALDEAIRATTASIPEENRKLLTYHDSFAYFAPEYGYTVIGAIQPADFSEPSAQEVASLIDQVRAEGVPAIFGSEVFPSPVLEQIGTEAGVSYIDELRDDDLPGEPGAPNHSYIGLMVYNLQIMAEALGGDPTLMDAVDQSNITGIDSAVDQPQ